MKKLNVENMSRTDFFKLPARARFNSDEGLFSSIVLLPTLRKHNSGYRALDFVGCRGNEPFCRLSGCSDVLDLEGIGGFGFKWHKKYGKCPDMIPVSGWAIDCLFKSGLFRIWPNKKIKVGAALSTFEIFSV